MVDALDDGQGRRSAAAYSRHHGGEVRVAISGGVDDHRFVPGWKTSNVPSDRMMVNPLPDALRVPFGAVAKFETLTILFTDMVDSTATLARLAPREADDFLRSHLALLRGVLADHEGEEVKNLGDGVMAAFASPSAALSAAVAMQQAVEHQNRTTGHDVGLRVGVSAGEVNREADDYFGTPVVEAARLCALALSGQILSSALVKAMAGRRATQSVSPLGELELKGLPDPVATLEVHREPLLPEAPGRLPGESLSELLDRCRRAYRDKDWKVARVGFVAADQESPLGPDDLVSLSTAARMLGFNDDSLQFRTRAYNELVSRGDNHGAIRCAFWIGLALDFNGEQAMAAGWHARAARLLDPDDDCIEQAYLLLRPAMLALFGGDPDAGLALLARAAEIGARFQDADVVTMARLFEGNGRTLLGDAAAGRVLQDEAMVAVTSYDVSPVLPGLVYCSVLTGRLRKPWQTRPAVRSTAGRTNVSYRLGGPRGDQAAAATRIRGKETPNGVTQGRDARRTDRRLPPRNTSTAAWRSASSRAPTKASTACTATPIKTGATVAADSSPWPVTARSKPSTASQPVPCNTARRPAVARTVVVPTRPDALVSEPTMAATSAARAAPAMNDGQMSWPVLCRISPRVA